MYEWLQQEITSVKTPRFHVVDGSTTDSLRLARRIRHLGLPEGYQIFVRTFGEARLYRNSYSGYKIGVFSSPRALLSKDDIVEYRVGSYDGSVISVLRQSDGSYKLRQSELTTSADVGKTFEGWLAEVSRVARSAYGKEKWDEILRGPPPFSPEEEAVLQARQHIHWRLIDIDASDNHLFEFTNQGDRIVPVLTLGVRSRNRALNGAIFFNLSELRPGQVVRVTRSCYKEQVPARDVEVFDLPAPRPEDRDYLRELAC